MKIKPKIRKLKDNIIAFKTVIIAFIIFLIMLGLNIIAITMGVSEYSIFSIALLKLGLILFLIKLIDVTLLKSIDIIYELKKGNMAVATLLSAIILSVMWSF
jgi:hypothetical protein